MCSFLISDGKKSSLGLQVPNEMEASQTQHKDRSGWWPCFTSTVLEKLQCSWMHVLVGRANAVLFGYCFLWNNLDDRGKTCCSTWSIDKYVRSNQAPLVLLKKSWRLIHPPFKNTFLGSGRFLQFSPRYLTKQLNAARMFGINMSKCWILVFHGFHLLMHAAVVEEVTITSHIFLQLVYFTSIWLQ